MKPASSPGYCFIKSTSACASGELASNTETAGRPSVNPAPRTESSASPCAKPAASTYGLLHTRAVWRVTGSNLQTPNPPGTPGQESHMTLSSALNTIGQSRPALAFVSNCQSPPLVE